MDRRIYYERTDDALKSTKHSIFKLELLDEYNISFETKLWNVYKKRGHMSPDHLYGFLQDHWNEMAQYKIMGLKLTRVHVVSLPISDYVKFELQKYIISQRIGEKIYFIDRNAFEKIKKPKGIRLMDLLRVDGVVFLTKYANVKGYVGGDMVGGFYIDEEWKVRKYKEYERSILKKAVPMDRFLKAH